MKKLVLFTLVLFIKNLSFCQVVSSFDIGFRVTPIYLKSPLGIWPIYQNKFLNSDKHLTGFYFSCSKTIFTLKNYNYYSSVRIRNDVSESTYTKQPYIITEGKSKFYYDLEIGNFKKLKSKKIKNLFYGYSLAINNLNSGYKFIRFSDSMAGKSNFMFLSPSVFIEKHVKHYSFGLKSEFVFRHSFLVPIKFIVPHLYVRYLFKKKGSN